MQSHTSPSKALAVRQAAKQSVWRNGQAQIFKSDGYLIREAKNRIFNNEGGRVGKKKNAKTARHKTKRLKRFSENNIKMYSTTRKLKVRRKGK